MFMFRIPHLGHLHLLRVSHEHPPEKILFKTASIMQIASILLICKLPNTSNFQILGLQFRNCQFEIPSSRAIHCCSMLSTPKLFWVHKKHSPNKLNHSLVSFMFQSVLPVSALPNLLFCHLRCNSTSRGIRHLYPKTLKSDTLCFNHRENLAENLELANAQHKEWKDIGKITAIHRTPVVGDHVKVQPS